MKMLVAVACTSIALWASCASAQNVEHAVAQTSPFDGLKVGGTVDHRRHEAKFDAPTTQQHVDEQAGGFGYRGFVGMDKVIGGNFVIGAEAGIGNGGSNIKSSGTAGSYTLDPQWSWDLSGRVGVTPSRSVLVYGRAGYNWLRTHETLTNVSAGQSPLDRHRTRGGFLWGVGAEFSVTDNFAVRTEFNQTNFGSGLKAARLQLGGAVRF
jgi:opacity protein-like surface antigen